MAVEAGSAGNLNAAKDKSPAPVEAMHIKAYSSARAVHGR
jgi:hypothetical protein